MITQKLLVCLLLVTSIPIAYSRHASLWGKLIFPSDIIVEKQNSYQRQNEKTPENQVDIQNNNAEIVIVDISGSTVNSEKDSYQVQGQQDPEIKVVVDIDGNVADSDRDKYEVQNRNIRGIVNYNGHKQTENVHDSGYQVDTQNNGPEISVVDHNGNIVNSENEEYQVEGQQNPEVHFVDTNGNVVNSDNDKYEMRNRDGHQVIANFANDYPEIIEVDMQNDKQKILDQSYPEIHLVNTSVKVQNTPVHHENNGEIRMDSGRIMRQVQTLKNSRTQVCNTPECRNYAESLINSMNKTVDPCEDFYEYACGRWEASNPVPPYKVVWNAFSIADHTAQRRLKEIFESKLEPSDILPVKQAKQWYQSCMNTERLEQRGIDPIKSIMMQIGGWPMAMEENKWNETQFTWQDVENHFARLTGFYAFYDVSVPTTIIGNVSILTLNAPELPLTGKAVSGLRDFKNNNYDGYRLLVSKIAELFGTSNGAPIPNDRLSRDSEELVLFEKAIFEIKNADPSQTGTQVRRIIDWYHSNKTNPLLGHPKSNIDWSSVIQNSFDLAAIKVRPASYVQIKNSGYIKGINELLKRTSRRTIVNYIHWNFIGKVFSFTNQKMREEFTYRIWDEIFKLKEREPRWLECVNEMKLTHAAAYAYVEKYFTPSIKSAAQDMVQNIRISLEQNIENSNWMDQKSKTLSKEKLNSLRVFVGFPDWYNKTTITDYYKGITIGSEYFENNLSYMRFARAQNLKLYVSPRPFIDPFISAGEEPTTSGAMYVRAMNYAEFPAAGFETQFFRIGLPTNVNYAKIGFIIGHEMGHAYDNCGITFGKDGKKTKLTDAVLRSFYERVDCFVNQYDEFHDNPPVVNGTKWKCNGEDQSADKTDGQRSAGENIADATGLQVVFQAYKKLSKQKNPNGEVRLPGLEEFTDDQLFFLSFASTWCEAEAPSYAELRSYSKHPQMSLRVLGPLSNTKDFAKAFNCPTDSWMNPTNRCSVWNKPGV